MVDHIEGLTSEVNWHIASDYTNEMAAKSNVVSLCTGFVCDVMKFVQVPLGVLFYDENKTVDMCSIMKHLHRYVPKKSHNVTYHLPNEDFVCTEEIYHRILFGGDQLTASRCRSAQSARCHDDLPEERFEGIIPVTEDWHARQTLMRVRIT